MTTTERLRELLADRRRWQGVDRHGAFIRDETTVIYLQDVLPRLLAVVEAADELQTFYEGGGFRANFPEERFQSLGAALRALDKPAEGAS